LSNNGIEISSNNEVHISGIYSGSLDTDLGAGSAIFNSNLGSQYAYTTFYTVLRVDGSFKSSLQIDSDDVVSALGMKLDNSGNVYMCGGYIETVDFDPNTTVFEMQGTLSDNDFVLKLKPANVGIEGLELNSFVISPNPSNGNFLVKCEAQSNFTLCNSLGQIMAQIALNTANNFQVEITQLKTGIYFIKNVNGSSQKITVQ
jgi:hypothetical protein